MVEIPDITPGAGPDPSIGINDLWRWSFILPQVITAFNSVRTLAVNGVVKLSTIKVKAFGFGLEWDMGSLKRVS